MRHTSTPGRKKLPITTSPEGGWWKALFIHDTATGDSTVLVEHPIADLG